VFLEKIQTIKSMARSTPLKMEKEEEENEARYQPIYNSRFQGPLDRVAEMREGNEEEEEREPSRKSRRNKQQP
jgi:hypothetical protein